MDVSLHVKIDAVFDHQWLERLLTGQADVRRVVLGADVPWPMKTDDHPRRLFAVDRGEIVLEPVVLLVRVSKWTAVRTGVETPCFVRRLDTDGEVSLGIDDNKVGEAVVEGVPEISQATGFVSGHAEVVDCGNGNRIRSRGEENVGTHCIR